MKQTNKFGGLEPTQKLHDVINGTSDFRTKNNTKQHQQSEQESLSRSLENMDVVLNKINHKIEKAYRDSDSANKS